jgi:hypothetical protein
MAQAVPVAQAVLGEVAVEAVPVKMECLFPSKVGTEREQNLIPGQLL